MQHVARDNNSHSILIIVYHVPSKRDRARKEWSVLMLERGYMDASRVRTPQVRSRYTKKKSSYTQDLKGGDGQHFY